MYVPVHGQGRQDLIEQDYAHGPKVYAKVYKEDFEEKPDDEVPEFLQSQANLDRIGLAGDRYSKKAEVVMKKLMAAQDESVIPLEVYEKVVGSMEKRQRGCLSLPLSLIFFVVFSMSSFLHEDITNVFLVESGLRRELSNGFDSVESIASFWDWTQETLIPRIFAQKDMLGAPLPPGDYNRVLMYNQLHGPLLMEQSRAKRESCTDSDGLLPSMTCYPEDTDSDETFGRNVSCTFSSDTCEYYDSSFSASSLERRLRQMRPELMGELPRADTASRGYQVMVFPTTDVAAIHDHVRYLQQKGWLDIQSKGLTITALFLNAEVGRPRLERLQILVSFSRGGSVFHRLTLESLFLEPFSGVYSVMADAVFVVMLVLTMIIESIRGVRAHREGALKHHMRRGQTWLEMAIIVFGLLCIFGYVYQNFLREDVQKALEEVVNEDTLARGRGAPRTDWRSYKSLGSQLHDDADAMITFSSYLKFLVSEYHLLLMVRFFGAFRAQPRLGVVTNTLTSSITDIAHFMVVLLPTFMAFAVSGSFIFGRRLEEFATFDAAIATCFKMAMEGEYDWPRLSEEHWWTAAIWVWTFMVLLVLLMLNMVLAIIMDVYNELRQHTARSVTVWQTVRNGVMRIWDFKHWVSNQELEASIKDLDEYFTKEQLRERFKAMPVAQEKLLLRECRYQAEVPPEGTDLNDSMKMCMSVKLSMDKVSEEIQLLVAGTAPEGQSVDMSQVERSWLSDVSKEMAVQNHMMLALQWHLQHLQSQWQAVDSLYGAEGRLDKAGKVDGDYCMPQVRKVL